jgi:NADPH2:quinone reductase
VIEIKAVGVNPVETYIRAGTYVRKPELPFTPGSDGAGVVLETGPGARKFKTGDRVYTFGSLSGTYAGKALCLESQLFPLPGNANFSQGAALGIPYGTAYRALFQKARAQKGETVLIHGASGGVGTAAIQLAHDAGLKIIATAGSMKGLELVKKLGADFTLDHTQAGHMQKIAGLTGGNSIDVILEMLANVNLARDLDVLAFKGRIVVIGSRGTVEIDPRMLMIHDAIVSGMLLFTTGETEMEIIHTNLAKGLINGSLSPVIGTELPLKEAAAAHIKVMSPGAYGKIVLVP